MMKKTAMFITVAMLFFNTLLLTGCRIIKFGNAGDLTYFRYFYNQAVETEEYGYEFIVYENEHAPGQVVVSLSISRNFDRALPLSYVVQGGTEILADIKAIFDEYDVYNWDGDEAAPMFSTSKTEFFVYAVFENTELKASNNIPGIHEKYIAGHKALSSYLRQCIETLPIRKITEQDLIIGLDIALPELEYSVSELFREGEEAPFHAIEESRQTEFRELLRDLANLYNTRIDNEYYTIDRNADAWASITTLDELNEDTSLMRVWTEYSFLDIYFTQDDFDSLASRIATFQNT